MKTSEGEAAHDPLTAQERDEVDAAIHKNIVSALNDGLPAEHDCELKRIMLKHDIWRLVLGRDPPADVQPMVIRLKHGSKPYRCKGRKYSPEQQEFMKSFNDQLEELGLVFENRTARWASQAYPVKKPGANEYRQTSDYRLVNGLTEGIVAVSRNLTILSEHLKGKRFFATLDFIKGFWQISLHKDSQEIMSYMTHDTVYTPTRMPQGAMDASTHFQMCVEDCLKELLYINLLVWIDDILVYSDTIDGLLKTVERVFDLLHKSLFKLSIKKCMLFSTSAKWCGKIFDANGVRHDPFRIAALVSMNPPRNAGELQQFICASNWMRESIPDFARAIQPLQDRLAIALNGTKKTKRTANGIVLSLDAIELDCFQTMKQKLAKSLLLAHPASEATMCLFTDASDMGWAIVLTQVHKWCPDTSINEQQHQFLACLSGLFRGPEMNWSVTENEAFPIVQACTKLDYLLLRSNGFKIYCDYRNLVHIFAPHAAVKKHVRGKLQRWAAKLTELKYTIHHIDGKSNLWADLLSRWGCSENAVTSSTNVRVFRITTRGSASRGNEPSPANIRPMDKEDFEWPSIHSIGKPQK